MILSDVIETVAAATVLQCSRRRLVPLAVNRRRVLQRERESRLLRFAFDAAPSSRNNFLSSRCAAPLCLGENISRLSFRPKFCWRASRS